MAKVVREEEGVAEEAAITLGVAQVPLEEGEVVVGREALQAARATLGAPPSQLLRKTRQTPSS